MSELGPEANELLEAGRQAFRPTSADRVRVLGAIRGVAAVTAGGAALTLAKTSWAGLRTAWHAASLIRVAAVVAPMAVGGAYLFQVATTQPVAPTPAPVAPVARAAAEGPQVKGSEAPAAHVGEMALPPSEPEERRPAPGSPAKPVGALLRENQVRQEVALLSKAQAELSRGRPQRALEALSEHAQQFPRGVLTEERMATRARALCALGRKGEAAVELTRVERMNPGSAYLSRAREACGSR